MNDVFYYFDILGFFLELAINLVPVKEMFFLENED
jgi:hypothetical protein